MKTLHVLIVEDEIPAQTNLARAIEKNFEDLRVVGAVSSVKGAVEWLNDPANQVDIIFMDVELSDGMCFDIFPQVEIRAKVIITTAFDNYAIRAFRVKSIDYLLKPIDPDELRSAVARCREQFTYPTAPTIDIEGLRCALAGESREYKKRFVVKIGDRIAVINTEEVGYFFSEDKGTYLVTRDNHRYLLDMSLDTASDQVDPTRFFRISRNFTAAIGSISSISKHSTNRLKVTLDPRPEFEVFVSRSRTNDFMEWLEGK